MRRIQQTRKIILSLGILVLGVAGFARDAHKTTVVVVAADGSRNYHSVQAAVDALPQSGGTIRILPGTYREVVTVAKAHVRLEGIKDDPSKVVLVFNHSHCTVGGTLKSASVAITGDDFFAEGITFANDFSLGRPLTSEGSQAVALLVRGDRAVLRHVRLLGFQDTLFVGSKSCVSEQGPCVPARQYLSDCYIEGNVDFIFGDAKAMFRNCEIHAVQHESAFLTAQSKHYPRQASGFVFDHCRVTADAGAQDVFLGRPWRPHSTVIFVDASLPANLDPTGWREWHPGETHSLETSFYAEFHSHGLGANVSRRDSHSQQLTKQKAGDYSVKKFLSGDDGWDPRRVQQILLELVH